MTNVELKRGFLPMELLTNVFVGGDDGTWAGFVRYNIESSEECDINQKRFATLTEEELTALADFCVKNEAKLKGIKISDYYFQIGDKRIAFGPRNWAAFLMRLGDYKKKSPTNKVFISKQS
jgi:hypothetical protein